MLGAAFGGCAITTNRQQVLTGDAADRCFPRLRFWAETLSTTHRGARREAVENRQRVLATARALFVDRGIEAVTMRDISQAAGIGQGTLYRRFSHKGALCYALMEDTMQQFHDALVARLEADADTVPALAQLRQLIERLLTFVEENGPLVNAMGDGACGVNPEERYQNPWAVWQREMCAILLERAIARDEIGPLDVEATVDLIYAVCDPPLYLHQRHQLGYSLERIVANLFDLLVGPPRTAE